MENIWSETALSTVSDTIATKSMDRMDPDVMG